MTMTPRHSTALLLPLLLLVATVTANRPPASSSVFRRGTEKHQNDFVVPPGPPGPEEESYDEGVLQQVARGVFPAPLWAAMADWSPDPQAAPGSTNKHTHQQERGWAWLKPLFNFYMPDTTNVSRSCKTDVESFYIELSRGRDWALKMVDAWGKLPDGLLAGNTWASGLLDACIAISVDQEVPQAHFKGQYCSIIYKKSSDETEEETTPKQGVRSAGVAGLLGLVIPYSVYATCIPSSCTKEEYVESLQRHLEGHGAALDRAYCQTEDMPSLEYTGADVTMIVVLSLLGALVLAGTCGDVWTVYTGRSHEETGHLRYVLVFSFYTNIQKIFNINVKEDSEIISCLHGIRVLTMSWVVLGHTYLMTFYRSANKLPMLQAIMDNPYPYQIIINGLASVDTFFFMSGLLVAYNLTKEFGRTGKFNIPVYYIHRFLRLAPPILLLCGVMAVFPPLYVRGTLSPSMTEPGNLVDLCRRYWWRDSFFLTNWFFNDVDTESCSAVGWYTAVDFQLYIVTPLMFLPLLYKRKPGAVWLGCLVLASAAIPAIITGVNEMPPTQVMNAPPEMHLNYTKWIYTKPYCRASPYLVGLVLGYVLREVERERVKMTWWQAVLGWIVALVIMSAVVFGITDYNDFSSLNHEYDAAVSIIYGGLYRLAWGVAMAWLVFACHMGYGGPINSFLAHPFWQPLSRLTYTTFLIAVNVQFIVYIYSTQIPLYYSNVNKVMETTGVILLSGSSAVLLSLLSESPVLGLEKLILRRGKRTVQENRQDSEAVDLQSISADISTD